MNKIVVGVTGASGAIYAKVLFDKLVHLREQVAEVGVVMSDNAKQVWRYELGNEDFKKIDSGEWTVDNGKSQSTNDKLPIKIYEKTDFMAPFASGSVKYNIMIVCPCSMGTLARIAQGISNDLITRAADVMLKERRRLILVIRDTPLGLIHINNMKTVTEAGGIICPASPSFYSKPQNFEQLVATVVDRVLDLAGFDLKTFRWKENQI
jgi:4-hydroxy-3-polyprenylbenzoate decarboxylase